MESFEGLPTIPEFFKGKTIFLTGGTGFMGKVFVEKILWSCPDLEAIYLLLRPKKGMTSTQRLIELEKSKLFERLRERDPNTFMNKVKMVNGDIQQLGLGLSTKERELLVETVDIVVHSAANVRFDDSLKDAVIMNTRGTREVMMLAREMKNIKVVMHISTVYCNTDKNPVEEILYPAHTDWRKTIEIVEKMDPEMLKALTSKYISPLPNTYVFTKALGEHVVNDLRGDIPAVILRPSIVLSSVTEPMPGWVENFNGPVGLLVACGKGIMRTLNIGADTKSDYMSVDYAIKAVIIAIWNSATKKKDPENNKEIEVYNSCSGKIKQTTYDEIIKMGIGIVQKNPLNDILWIPGGGFTKFKIVHYIRLIFLQLLPAAIIDVILKANGYKPLLFKVQRRIFIATNALRHYIENEWTFKNEKFLGLRSLLLPSDIKSFTFDIENIDIEEYFTNGVLGARRYLLNEPDETIPKAVEHYKRLYILDRTVKVIFWGLIIWYLLKSNFMRFYMNEGLHLMGLI